MSHVIVFLRFLSFENIDVALLLFQLDVYASHSQALINGKKMSGAIVPVGNFSLPVYIAPLPNDK